MKLLLGPDKYKTEFEFYIPPTEKIGVFVSGGLDSAILLCLIIEELKLTNRLESTDIATYTAMKYDGSLAYAPRIVELIKEHYKIPITINNNIPNDGIEADQVSSTCVYSIMSNSPDRIFYMGINRQVSPEIKKFNVNLNIDYPDETDQIKFPFLNMIKPNIVDLYLKFNLEHLIPYAHSCTGLLHTLCNKCYSCEEREWAYEELNLKPTFIPVELSKLTWFRGGGRLQ